MRLVTWFKALYNLSWNTAVDVSTYRRAAAFIMVLCLLIGIVIGTTFILAYKLSQGRVSVAAAASAPFVLFSLWIVWQNIKLGANRFHDLGYGLVPYVVYVLWGFALGAYASYVALHPGLPLWARFFAAEMQILSLTISYFLFFEPGVAGKVKYARATLYKKAPGWIEKIAMAVTIGFIFVSALRNLARFIA